MPVLVPEPVLEFLLVWQMLIDKQVRSFRFGLKFSFFRFFCWPIKSLSPAALDLGGEEAQLAGMSLMDSSRRRASGLAMNSGTFAKQKSPIATDTAVPKDAGVRLTISYDINNLHLSTNL